MNEELLQRLYFLGQQDGLDPQKTSYDDFKNLVITKPELVDRLYQLSIPDGLDTTRTSLDSFRSSLGVTAPQKKKRTFYIGKQSVGSFSGYVITIFGRDFYIATRLT